MKRLLAPLLLTLLAASAGGCSGADVPDLSEANAALEAHRYHEARAAFQAIRQDEGASEANSLQLAQVMIGLGDGYVAERYLTEVADQTSGQWTTLMGHAMILQGRAFAAEQLVSNFAGDPPDDGSHDWLLVWAAMEQGDVQEAEDRVDAALRAHPQSAPLHAKAARLSIWRDNWDAAERHAQEALESDPLNYEALLVRGESQIAQGDPQAALTTYELLVQTYPDYAVPQANVVGLLLDLGRVDEAEVALNRALSAHPNFALLRFNLVRLHVARENWTEAREQMQTLSAPWRRNLPAASLLEADIEAALGNHAMARTLYTQLADDPRFAGEVEAKLAGLAQK